VRLTETLSEKLNEFFFTVDALFKNDSVFLLLRGRQKITSMDWKKAFLNRKNFDLLEN
jgi:hypothetical protein